MTRAAALALLAGFLGACGYHAVHGATSQEKLHVVLVASKVPDAVASDEVLAGMREELARAGALAAGDGFPRIEVEVLRADEASEGIAAVNGTPAARATRVGMVGRAWIARADGGASDAPRERDTGDMRAMETASTAIDEKRAMFEHLDAQRGAGRRLGKRLADRILGLPAASEE